MRHRMLRLAVPVLAGLLILTPVAAEKGDEAQVELKLMKHLPHDPVLVWVMTIEDPARSLEGMLGWLGRFADEEESAQIAGKLEEADAKLGFSLKADLLAHLGPEFGVAIDLPPIDQVAEMFSTPQQGLESLLGRLGLLATVRDVEKIDGCLRRLVELAEGRISEADGLSRIELGPEGEQAAPDEMTAPSLFYAFKGKVLALGASDEWVRTALDRGSAPGLADGEDFKRVFAHLDAAPKTLTYINLPKLAEMVRSSAMLQAMIQANEEASQAAKLFLAPEFVGVGLGATSVETDGGVRTTTFSPEALGGGSLTPGIIAAIAIPNFLNAIDRGKQKRTMADLRSIGTASEAFSIDNERYPGPTEGWVELDAVATDLEPVYIRSLPRLDGWGNPFLYWSDGTSYRILSRGKDGEEDRDWAQADLGEPTATQEINADIVFADGSFAVYPEGD